MQCLVTHTWLYYKRTFMWEEEMQVTTVMSALYYSTTWRVTSGADYQDAWRYLSKFSV